MIRSLEDYDFEVLESYWIRFNVLSDVEDEKRKANAENIKQVIETQYNEADERMRTFIEVRYFGSAATEIEAIYELEDSHDIKRPLYKRMREKLLKETAERISWV